MFKVESSIVIKAPVNEVYDWMEHPHKHHDWQHSLLESRKTDDGKVVVVRKFMGRKMETHFHEFHREPGRRLHRRGESGPGMPLKYTVEQETTFDEVDGGTKVTITSEVNTHGLIGKAVLGTLSRVTKHELDASLAHLKELVEAEEELHGVLADVPRHA